MGHSAATQGTTSPPSCPPSSVETWSQMALFDQIEQGRSSGYGPVEQLDLPPWSHGECLTCNTLGHRSAGCVSLSSLLEPAASIPPKYWLSQKACAGILRRANNRGKALPPALEEALRAV